MHWRRDVAAAFVVCSLAVSAAPCLNGMDPDDFKEGGTEKRLQPIWTNCKDDEENVTMATTDSVVFDCHAQGNPISFVEWYKNNAVIHLVSSEPRIQASEQGLAVSDLNVNDSGEYRCVVTNGFGSISRLWRLHVIHRTSAVTMATADVTEAFATSTEMVAGNSQVEEVTLFVARIWDIRVISLNGTDYTTTILPLEMIQYAIAIDHDPIEDYVYWTDGRADTINRARVDGSGDEDLISTEIENPIGLAVDWIGRNLYWADAGTNRIEVARLDGTFRRVLFSDNIGAPGGICLDPMRGYMYWTDRGIEPKIERAHMDGNDRVVLIDKDIGWPNDIAIDYEEQTLYWFDGKKHTLEAADFDGLDRKVLFEESHGLIVGVTLLGDYVYWTDHSKGTIERANKHNATDHRVMVYHIPSPRGLEASKVNMAVVPNPCVASDCSHLCLLSPRQPYYSCACPTGVQLLSDKRICARGGEEMLFVARRSDIRVIPLNIVNNTDEALPLEDIRKAVGIDYDPVEGYVYWTDNRPVASIRRAFLNGSGDEDLITTNAGSFDGLAVDWIGRNLYWTDAGTDRIEVARLDGAFRKVIFSENLDRPRAISLDPVRGYMYWTDWGKEPKIERANMDGDGRIVLFNTGLGRPNGIAIDSEEQTLYWTDGVTDRIEVANVDGTGRRILVSEGLRYPFGITLLGDYLYWTDQHRRTIEQVNKHDAQDRRIITDQRQNLMGIKASKVKLERVQSPCNRNHDGCSHLCLVSPWQPYFSCACPTGYTLLADNTTCIDDRTTVSAATMATADVTEVFATSTEMVAGNSHEEETLFVARIWDIRVISLNGTDYTITILPLEMVQYALAIDHDPVEDYVYWTDRQADTINRARVDGSGDEDLISTEIDNPNGLAVDWIGRNLYWADAGTDRIEVARLDGTFRRVLFSENIDTPRGICLDPLRGYMYWTDRGIEPKIERAHMDGNDRVVLIDTDIGWPNDIAIDYEEQTLYWFDGRKHTLEASDVDGLRRKVLLEGSHGHIFGVTLLGDYVYWTDSPRGTIERANKHNATDRRVMVYHLPGPTGLEASKVNMAVVPNPCVASDCSHLCLLSPRQPYYSCACPTGVQLLSDKRICARGGEEMLFVARRSDIRVIPLNVVNNTDEALPMEDIRKAVGIDYDPVEGYVYWTDNRPVASIRRAFLNGSGDEVLITTNAGSFDGVAVDWIGRNLYWTDAGNDRIEMAGLDGTFRKVLFSENLDRPRAISLDPVRGYMFWTDWGKQPKIERANMDGGGRIVLFNTGLGRPYGMVIDSKEQKLYWTDGVTDRIEVANVDGTGRRILVRKGLAYPFGLTLLGDYLYWTDRHRRTIERVNKHDAQDRRIITDQRENLMDIKASKVKIARVESPCNQNHDGCSHLCLMSPWQPYFSCACPTGYTLLADNKTCIDDTNLLSSRGTKVTVQYEASRSNMTLHIGPASPHLLNDQTMSSATNMKTTKDITTEITTEAVLGSTQAGACETYQHRCGDGTCIPTSQVCDDRTDCMDGSDEVNCTASRACPEGYVRCQGGKCIFSNWVCDGDADCPGGTDEMNCTLKECHQRYHGCDGGKCIPKTWVCDGKPHCKDGTDEQDCGHVVV